MEGEKPNVCPSASQTPLVEGGCLGLNSMLILGTYENKLGTWAGTSQKYMEISLVMAPLLLQILLICTTTIFFLSLIRDLLILFSICLVH